ELSSRPLASYIRGFQGDALGPESVACMTKHFPGGGPHAGVVCTDWGLITDADLGEWVFYAKCWGVEDLSAADRVAKIVDAGCDQLGGENDPSLLVELIRSGRVGEERIDESARRLLRVKFTLGLFDNPSIDEDAAAQIAGRDDFPRTGQEAQR